MTPRNLLVLLLPDGSEATLRRAVEERADGPLKVRIVAPTHVSPLEWLANDEDDARREAAARALEVEWMLDDQAEVAGEEAGDVDPVQAVEDALRTLPSDEILIVGGANENGALESSLRRFGVPVTRIDGSSPPPEHPRLRETSRAVIAGRSEATPFIFFASVNLALIALTVLIAGIAVLVLWLL